MKATPQNDDSPGEIVILNSESTAVGLFLFTMTRPKSHLEATNRKQMIKSSDQRTVDPDLTMSHLNEHLPATPRCHILNTTRVSTASTQVAADGLLIGPYWTIRAGHLTFAKFLGLETTCFSTCFST